MAVRIDYVDDMDTGSIVFVRDECSFDVEGSLLSDMRFVESLFVVTDKGVRYFQ